MTTTHVSRYGLGMEDLEPTRPDRPPPGRIRGQRVWLRALERSDLDAYRDAANSVEVGTWAGYPFPHSEDTTERWYERVLERHGQDEYYFAISPLGSDEFIGAIWLWGATSRLAGLELSVFVTAEAGLGQGIGSDAIGAALDFVFGGYELERIWLTTELENRRAQRAFEKAGFQRDGVIRHHFRRGGRWRDSALMAIVREDWEALDRPRSWDLAAQDT
jgi:RimJ/RimL family protein N-acetyltransferase